MPAEIVTQKSPFFWYCKIILLKANACHFISNVFLFLIHWQFYSLMRFYCFYICYWFERYMLTIILISASLNFSLFQQQWLSNASGNCHPEVSLLLVLQNYLTQGSKCVPTSSIREWRPTQKQQLISNLQIYPHGTNMTADNTAGWHTGAILEILQQQFRRVYLQLYYRERRDLFNVVKPSVRKMSRYSVLFYSEKRRFLVVPNRSKG